MIKPIKSIAKNSISLAKRAKQGLKDLVLAAKKKTEQYLQRLFAQVSRPLKAVGRKYIKWQDKILFDGKTALFFITGALYITVVVKAIESILQTEIVPYQNIQGIYGILGTLLGALFIFTAAEGLRDRNEKHKVRILLNSSKLNTLIFLFLLSLISLIFPQLYIFSLAALIMFIFFSIYSVYQILSILLNIEVLWNKRIDLFKNRIKKVTDFAIDCRSKSKAFLDRMSKGQIKLQHLCAPHFMNLEELKIRKEGIVTDIDLDGLQDISDKIDKAIIIARQNKAISDKMMPKLSKNPQINAPGLQSFPQLKETKSVKKTREKRYFSIDIGSSIKEETSILSFDKDIKVDKRKIQNQLNEVITVEKSNIISEVKSELEEFKSMTEKFIKEKNFNQFERHLKFYLDMAEEFLNQLSKHQLYSYQEAKADSGMLLGESSSWPPLSWLTDHVMSFFEKAREIKKTEDSESKNIYTEIKWLSYHLINLSKEKKDHLLFQNSLALWQRQFFILSNFDKEGINEKDMEEKKKDLKDHIDFFEKHIVVPTLFGNIEEEITEEEENYTVFLLEVIKGIFERVLRKKLYFLLPHLEKIIYLIAKKTSDPALFMDRKYIGEYIEEIKYSNINPLVFKAPSSYESRRLQFLFGLGSYLGSQPNSDLDRIKKIIRDSIPRLADLESYLRIYPLMMSEETEIWRWEFFIRKTGSVKRYFLSLMLDIPKMFFDNLNISNLEPKELSILEGLARFSQESLKNIKNLDEGRENIKNLFDKISQHQNKKRIDYVKKEELDDNKIKDFIQNFSKEFIKEQSMRKFFKCRQGQKHHSSSVFVINQILEEKIYFLPENNESNVKYLNIPSSDAKHLSFHLANSFFGTENKFLQDEILKKCRQKELFYSQFKELISNRQWKNSEMMLLSPSAHSKIILRLPNLNDLNISNKSVFIHQKEIKAIILDRSKLPALEMFNPAEPEKELFPFQYLKDIGISIGISSFSHNPELMKFLIDNPPDWLKRKGDEKAQREFLNTRVNIKILQGIHLFWEKTEYIGEAFNLIDEEKP